MPRRRGRGRTPRRKRAADADDSWRTTSAKEDTSCKVPEPCTPRPLPPPEESHPLQTPWTVWCGKGWRDVHATRTVDTVESFTEMLSCMAAETTRYTYGAQIALFRKGISPTWEDPVNANGGGKWLACADRRQEGVDLMWLNTLLAVAGEQFEESDDVVGAQLNCRKGGFRISVWTRAMPLEAAQRLGTALKDAMFVEVDPKAKKATELTYKLHGDALKSKRSFDAPTLATA
jgi:translation initiation factor 4E